MQDILLRSVEITAVEVETLPQAGYAFFWLAARGTDRAASLHGGTRGAVYGQCTFHQDWGIVHAHGKRQLVGCKEALTKAL